MINEFGLDVMNKKKEENKTSENNDNLPLKFQYYILKKVPIMISETVYISCSARSPGCG
jgi:hypothetical protein